MDDDRRQMMFMHRMTFWIKWTNKVLSEHHICGTRNALSTDVKRAAGLITHADPTLCKYIIGCTDLKKKYSSIFL